VATILLGLLVAGCELMGGEQTIVGEPIPGSFRLVTDPPVAPFPVTIRYLIGGDASRAYHEFSAGERILVVFTTLPGEEGVQVNGRACEGRYTIAAGLETDVLVVLRGESCRVEVTGSHPEGLVHTDPFTKPKLG
jgi:hypothetical protein